MIGTVVTSSILIIIVLILWIIFHGKISGRAQYAIWAIAIVCALFPFILFYNPVSIMEPAGPTAVEKSTDTSTQTAVAAAVNPTGKPAIESKAAGNSNNAESSNDIGKTDSSGGTEAGIKASEDNLLRKLKSALPDNSTITSRHLDYFSKDNRQELFAVVNIGKEGETDIRSCQIWYADEERTKMLLEGSFYLDTVNTWDVGNQKLFYIEEGYGGSGSVSHVWSAKKGIPCELEHAGEMLKYAGNLQFYTYPGAFDLLSDGTGHTWKRYYLYFDETTGMFKEYGGISISKKDLSKLQGVSVILDEINNKGYKITDIFYRKNGIVNINYTDGEYNLNITLTVENGRITSRNPVSINSPDYDTGGIYKSAAFKEIATYPEKFEY